MRAQRSGPRVRPASRREPPLPGAVVASVGYKAARLVLQPASPVCRSRLACPPGLRGSGAFLYAALIIVIIIRLTRLRISSNILCSDISIVACTVILK